MKRGIILSLLVCIISVCVPAADAGRSESLVLAEIDTFMAKAVSAIESRHLSEAILSYVSVLSLADENSSPAVQTKAREARSALEKIGTRLSLEPSSDWIDAKGSQKTFPTRTVGKDEVPGPAVFLFENYGDVKSPVADASISFMFTKNSGSLLSSVTTDAYGKANSTIEKLDKPGEAAVIRAYPEFRARGKSYAFTSVFRDFVYLPAVDAALVMALESSELGRSEDPKTLGAVVDALKPTGLDLVAYNGKLSEDRLREAYGGKTGALAMLGISEERPYAVLILVEVGAARQMEYGGKTYAIFSAEADCGFRILRHDGSVLISFALGPVRGQGGTRVAAVSDAYKRVSEELAFALRNRLSEITSSLASE
jgi:hypothetical protein